MRAGRLVLSAVPRAPAALVEGLGRERVLRRRPQEGRQRLVRLGVGLAAEPELPEPEAHLGGARMVGQGGQEGCGGLLGHVEPPRLLECRQLAHPGLRSEAVIRLRLARRGIGLGGLGIRLPRHLRLGEDQADVEAVGLLQGGLAEERRERRHGLGGVARTELRLAEPVAGHRGERILRMLVRQKVEGGGGPREVIGGKPGVPGIQQAGGTARIAGEPAGHLLEGLCGGARVAALEQERGTPDGRGASRLAVARRQFGVARQRLVEPAQPVQRLGRLPARHLGQGTLRRPLEQFLEAGAGEFPLLSLERGPAARVEGVGCLPASGEALQQRVAGRDGGGPVAGLEVILRRAVGGRFGDRVIRPLLQDGGIVRRGGGRVGLGH